VVHRIGHLLFLHASHLTDPKWLDTLLLTLAVAVTCLALRSASQVVT
jgi:hypothetical protein